MKYINYFKTIFCFGACLIAPLVLLTAQQDVLIDKIIATVGDKIILTSDVEQGYLQATNQGITGEYLRCDVLDQLLLEKMFIHQAVLDSLVVSEEEVEGELESRLRYFISLFNGDTEKLESYYNKSLDEIRADFKDDIRELLLARRMQSQVVNNISVTPSEVKAFFEQIPVDSLPYFNAEVELAELIIKPQITQAAKEAVRTKLREIKGMIEDGRDFAKLAKTYSEDPGSAPSGGDLGMMERGQLVGEYEAAAFKLQAGELSGIVETQFGFHLIQLIERRGNKIHTRHILIKPEISDEQLEATETYADSIRMLIVNDSISFADAVARFSEDELSQKSGGILINQQTGQPIFEMNQLDPSIYFAIDTLKAAEISAPVLFDERDGSQVIKLFHVISRTKPHLANLKDDYNKIQNVVKAQKQQEALEKWIKRYVPRTYIAIDEVYLSTGCPILDKWQD